LNASYVCEFVLFTGVRILFGMRELLLYKSVLINNFEAPQL